MTQVCALFPGVEEWRRGCLGRGKPEVGQWLEGMLVLPNLPAGSLGFPPLTRPLPPDPEFRVGSRQGGAVCREHMCVRGDEWAGPCHNSLGLSKGPPPAGSVELDPDMWASTASGKKAGQPSPLAQSICPLFPSHLSSPLLSVLLWASRAFFPPALVPEWAIHSVTVKMTRRA